MSTPPIADSSSSGSSTSVTIPKYALQSVNGTRDFPPNEMAARDWLFKTWDQVSQLHNFRKYDAPVVEHAELYTRKGGDDILKEMFSFTSEKKTLCLRPEMTPTLARMAIMSTDVLPLKWFCQAQCWRFETVTKGRKREHYQWNADILGGDPVKTDVEVLSMIAMFFEKVGLTPDEVGIKISHRGLLQGVFEAIGVDSDRLETAFNLVDKIEKLERTEFINMLMTYLGITMSGVNLILQLTSINKIEDLATIPIDNEIWKESVKNITAIFGLINEYGISQWLQFDASIVRGLSYYTGMVFEGFYKKGTIKKALVGGGRYDNLTQAYKPSSKLTAVGFGMGDVVIMDVLKELGKLPEFGRKTFYCIGAYGENNELFGKALSIAKRLREAGKQVDVCTKNKVKHIVTYANKIGAENLLLITPDNWEDGLLVLKDLKSGEQQTVTIDQLLI